MVDILGAVGEEMADMLGEVIAEPGEVLIRIRPCQVQARAHGDPDPDEAQARQRLSVCLSSDVREPLRPS
jgi:hypothetical protein